MRRVTAFFVLWAVTTLLPASAFAKVQVQIDISSQTMQVYVNGFHHHSWRVSTGRRGYETPLGRYRPKRLELKWYSTKYEYAPMPYSVFFRGGYAIHGTNDLKRLGRRASHGCVRLAPRNAAKLFRLVRQYGMRNTVISISR